MEIRQELSTKLLQKLVLTPQLQLAIKLLQLSRLELAEEIRSQLESNPVLEEEADGEPTVAFDEAASERPNAVAENDGLAAREPEPEAEEREAPSSGSESEWAHLIEDYNRFSTGPSVRVSNDEFPSVEATVARKTTLADHLMWQIQLSELSERDREIGAVIVGNLNEDGYLKDVTSEDLARQAGVEVADVERVLSRIQSLDPVGVAARDLKECLLIQARTYHPDNRRLALLIERFLPELERKNFAQIARGLRCSLEEVKVLVDTVTRMEPRPGRAYSSEEVVYLQPDVYVFKVGDEYVTVLNDDGLPKLKISPYYEETLAKANGDTRDFLQEKYRYAMWLIRSLQQRQSTLRKVTESIVRFQRDFLEKGVTALKPLVLRDVAEDVGMHESTISRVTTNKYVHTPQGIFELKYFFNSRIVSESGDDCSSKAVKSRIRALVEAEDPRNPLSDQQIVELLRKEHVVIARRTVAKYREALGILPSARRRRLV